MNKKELDLTWEKYHLNKDEEGHGKLVSYYFEKLVKNIANKLAKKYNYKVSADELASFGVDGLYRAIENFDPSEKVKFTTYSQWRIRGSMIDGLRSIDWVPRSVRQKHEKIEKTTADLEMRLGRKVDISEVLEELEWCEESYHKNVKKFNPTTHSSIEYSVNPEITGENKKDFNKYLCDDHQESPDAQIFRKEFLGKLIGKSFNDFERKLIYYYYYEDLTMKEISDILGISESRISQIHQSLLVRMKKKIEVNPEFFDKDIIASLLEKRHSSSLF